MSFAIVRCGAALPETYDRLASAAAAEGFDFLARLRKRWNDSAYDSDRDASVFGGFVDGDLQAIGAQTCDEHDPDPMHRRIRHFYVHPAVRRAGVGRTLATALIQQAFQLAPRLHLRATHPLSTAFWDAMGFARVDHPTRTHVMLRDGA